MYSYITLGWLWAKVIKLNALGKKPNQNTREEYTSAEIFVER